MYFSFLPVKRPREMIPEIRRFIFYLLDPCIESDELENSRSRRNLNYVAWYFDTPLGSIGNSWKLVLNLTLKELVDHIYVERSYSLGIEN